MAKEKINSTAPTSLTDKQRRFCEEYVKNGNAIEAAKIAGISGNGNPSKYYVYLLINSANGHIFYVGKGRGNRSKAHFSAFRNNKELNPAKVDAINLTLEMGGKVIDFIFAPNLEEPDAFRIERHLIKLFKNLANISIGCFHKSELTILRAKNSLARMISEKEMLLKPVIVLSDGSTSRDVYYRIKNELQKIIEGQLPIREIIYTFRINQKPTTQIIRY